MFSSIYKPALSLFALLSSRQKRGGVVCVIVMMTLALSEILAASLIVKMATEITAQSPDTQKLLFLCMLCLAVFVFKGGLALTDSFVQNRWIQKIILDFKGRLIRRYTKMSYEQHISAKSSDSLSVLYNDADVYMRIGLTSMGVLLSEMTVFFVLLGYLIYLQPPVTGVLIFIFSLLAIIFLKFLIPVFKEWGRVIQETVKGGYQAAILVLQSYKDILIFGKTDYFVDKYMHQSLLRAQVAVKSGVAQVIPRVVLEIIFIAFFVGLVSSFLWTGNDISELTAVLSAYLYAGFRLLPSMNRMAMQVNNIKMSEPSITRIVEEVTSPINENVYISEPDLKFEDAIYIEGLSYIYPGKKTPVLDGVSLDIRKGEFIGIVGETGSGKSTLLYILLGLLQPQKGSVLIDKAFHTNTHEWHNKIGYAAQDFQLVDGTIIENIAYGVPADQRDEKRVKQVVKDAQLEKFVAGLPEQLETHIGEKGLLVSGGERQRIALARALYKKPEVLVLDEATSALDLETEKSIMEAIKDLKDESLTIIAVTHRLDTLVHADRVIKINKGKIENGK